MVAAGPSVELLVCITCRVPQPGAAAGEQPGRSLFHALAADPPEGVRVQPVVCLGNCARGCTIALRGCGRWSYVYGGIDGPADASLVRTGAVQYLASADGLVPWRERPERLRRNCIARLPPTPLPGAPPEGV
jgi:predicted metal-binding protein